jgi:hypothetical protein
LETFDGYRYPIQRADAIRYFVLAYYGGTYLDLDDVRGFINFSKYPLLTDTGLPTPSRSSSFLPSMGSPNEADRNL